MLTLDKIYHASFVLKDVIRHTDLVHSEKLNPEADVWLKPENLQLTGSFKLRGSGYMISQLSDEEKSHGVIACSAGNHAQGVALAATKYGIKSLICLPDGAPISKVEATKNYGAEVCRRCCQSGTSITRAVKGRASLSCWSKAKHLKTQDFSRQTTIIARVISRRNRHCVSNSCC